MNIKGNTQIILSDAKTGKVIKHTDDDNMVTNGVFEFIRSHGMTIADAFNNNDIKTNPLTTLLGGVYLFHDSQTDDVDNIKPDGGNALVANGAYDVSNSQGRTLGNFNASESGWMSDSIFRFVYDWTSAQGNGVISSVSLTSRIAGMLGLGRNAKPLPNVYLDSYTTYQVSYNERAMIYEGTDHEMALCIKNNIMYSYHFEENKIYIHKQHICDTEMAFDDSRDLKPITSSKVVDVANFNILDEGETREGTVYPCIHAYGYFWMLISIQRDYVGEVQNAPQGTEHIYGVAWRMIKIKDDFSECTTALIKGGNMSGFSSNYEDSNEKKMIYQLDRQAGFFPTSANSFSMYACIGNDKDAEHHQSPYLTYGLYRATFGGGIGLGGTVHSYSQNYSPSMYIFTSIVYHANGVSCGSNWVGTEDGDIWECEVLNTGGGRGVACVDKSLYAFASGNGNINVGRVADYLASINNLSSPVTKDNTQNMKLIYTLTFTD